MAHSHIDVTSLQLDLTEEIKEKLHQLCRLFQSRMNGATAEQMRLCYGESKNYTANDGVALSDIKDIAEFIRNSNDEKLSFKSEVEFSLLWRSGIREAMLIALLLVPNKMITPSLIVKWMRSIPTLEMAEMLPFLTGWKTEKPDETIKEALKLPATAIRNTCINYLMGRFLQHGKALKRDTIESHLTTLPNCDSMTIEYQSYTFLQSQLNR